MWFSVTGSFWFARGACKMNPITSTFVERGNPELQDRMEILRVENRIVLVVADGAGGRNGAAQAAEFVIRSTRKAAESLRRPADCFQLLYETDKRIAQANDCGETTAVIVVLCCDQVFGANVGDSAAWMFTPGGKEELSRVRKPYLGTGVAVPHQFEHHFEMGTVVVASDGLWKYASLERIEAKVRQENPAQLAEQLSNLVRLRSGAFQDDVSIATCRIHDKH